MENENKNKKIRNPFPWIGKVFKYEMKQSVRTLLPIYIVTIVFAFLTGIFYSNDATEKVFSGFSISITGNDNKITGFMAFFYFILLVATAAVSVSMLAKRFKSGLLEDEAYLNLALPVTIGEHLWGRILTVLVWALAYIIMLILSFSLLMEKWYWSSGNFAEDIEQSFAFISAFLMGAMALMMFIYCINAIGHLSKKHRGAVKVLAVIVIASVSSRLFGNMSYEYFSNTNDSFGVLYLAALFEALLSVIFGTVTYFILNLKLNLE